MNVLLLEVEELSVHYLGCYGNEWLPTPALDGLAALGVVFDNHFAECLEPEKAQQLWEIDLPVGYTELKCEASSKTIAKIEDLLSTNDPMLVRAVVHLCEFSENAEDLVEADHEDAPLSETELTHAQAVSGFDSWFFKLFERLTNQELLENTAICFTARCGFGTAENSGRRLSEELLHVPLLICLPGAAQAGRHVNALTQPMDLPATFAELFDIEPAPETGYSLMPLMRGQAESVRGYMWSTSAETGDSERAIRTLDWALYRNAAGVRRLYAKPGDRWEVNDVLQHHLDLADQLEEQLGQFQR
jgi:arylsulfatase A-like enzyme